MSTFIWRLRDVKAKVRGHRLEQRNPKSGSQRPVDAKVGDYWSATRAKGQRNKKIIFRGQIKRS